MFKVSKSAKPAAWTSSNYRDPIIVRQVKEDFYGKCYICEQKDFPNINIEHFIPHEGDINLKLDWNNLYYACSRCNAIKNIYFNNMLDCCNPNHLVDEWIGVYYRTPDEDIEVVNNCPLNSRFYNHTEKSKELIFKCFNSANSGIQEVSKEDLREKIIDVHSEFLELRRYFFKNLDNWIDEDKIKEVRKIRHRLNSHYSFSAILRGFLEKDSKWRKEIEKIERLESEL